MVQFTDKRCYTEEINLKFILTNFGNGVSIKSHHTKGAWKLGPHVHQFIEICCVIDGTVTLMVDKVKKNVHKGDFAVIHPFRLHQYVAPEQSKMWVGVFSDQIIDGIGTPSANNVWGEDFIFRGSDSLFNYVTEHLPPESDEHMPVDFDSPLMYNVKAVYCAVMEEFATKIPQTSVPSYSMALASIYKYIEEHFKEDICIKDISDALGYSEKYISHTLAAVPNSNFRKILNQRRIANARYYLRNTDRKIIDIATLVGFKQERTFYRAFEKEVNMTPFEYRKKYRR